MITSLRTANLFAVQPYVINITAAETVKKQRRKNLKRVAFAEVTAESI
jgi:hypothetical protein